MKFLAAVALPFYALDQITKWWVHTHLALDPNKAIWELYPHVVQATADRPLGIEVIPGWFNIVYHGNTGAAFSMGSGGNNWFFIVLSVVAFVALLFAWKRNVFPDRLSRWGVALILSGILGIVTDRIVHGYVVDMIQVYLHLGFQLTDPYPTFNVADSCIFVAAAFFIIAGIADMRRPRVAA